MFKTVYPTTAHLIKQARGRVHDKSLAERPQPEFFIIDDIDESWTPTPADRAKMFHSKNPEVMKRIVGLCRKFRKDGNEGQWGIKGAFEQLRYMASENGRYDDFKLNNSYTAWYSREIMRLNPDLGEIFKTREQR